jgi:hypothetical protein
MMTLLLGSGLAALPAVAGDEGRPQLAAAEGNGTEAFSNRGKLNDAELNAVSGLGADAAGDTEHPEAGDVSVILFDELGRPKRNGLSPGNGGNSSVVRGVHVQVGR